MIVPRTPIDTPVKIVRRRVIFYGSLSLWVIWLASCGDTHCYDVNAEVGPSAGGSSIDLKEMAEGFRSGIIPSVLEDADAAESLLIEQLGCL